MDRQDLGTKASGFSLIEVLVAVVVLSFGLLALTALQSNLIKSSADARAQSIGLALAKDRLEQMRGFQNMAQYLSLTNGSDTINDSNAGTGRFSGNLGGFSTGNLGGTSFSRSWAVTRYALTISGGTPSTSYSVVASNTGALNPANYVQNSEYKTVAVTVSWVDASNVTRNVRIEDAIAALDPLDSARNQRYVGGRVRGPKVVIFDPSTDPGVIPIAVGNGSDTAATNPKPVVQARTGDDSIETRFDVLTYSALTGGKALAQAKVETSVIGCTCTNATTTEIGYRPTYWNGYRYAPPTRATASSNARAASGVTQSRYCTECCRDHHDPAGVSGPKFSPRRGTHAHYKLQGGSLVAAGANDDYLEACRLIRVDGIFDVAADLSDDYMNLLDTTSNGANPQPSSSQTSGYQNFVLNYLQDRFGVSSQSTATQYNNRAAPDPGTYALAQGVQTPRDEKSFNPTNGLRWLHSRGLYVDYLEPVAVDALNDAKTNCPGTGTSPPNATQLRDCALRALPFTSINLTELAEWTPLSGTQIKVTNADFDTSPGFVDPVRGKVTPGSSPTNGLVTNAVARASASNSGVAIFGDIDPDDVAGVQTATQPLRISGTSSGSPGADFKFGTNAGYAINNSDPRKLGFTHPTTGADRTCGVSGTTNPVVCTTQSGESLPSSITLRIGNYNKSGTDTIQNPCRNNGTTTMPYRVVYDVTGFTSTNASASFSAPGGTSASCVVSGNTRVCNDGLVGDIPTGEYTEVVVSQVQGDDPATAGSFEGDTITATLGSPTYMCPSNYPNPGGNTANGSAVPDARYQCSGTGSNAAPTWSTTWVACPASAGTPPNFN